MKVAASPKVIASFNPRDFASDFDVTHELQENKSEYTTDKEYWISLYSVPMYMFTCIDRLRSRVESTQGVGISPAMACCIVNGIETLSSHPDVVELLDLKSQVDNLPSNIDAEDLQEIYNYLQTFRVSIPDTTLSGTKRQNVKTPLHVKNKLYEFSGAMGVNASKMAIIALMTTLATQDNLLSAHITELSSGVKRFLKATRRRKRIASLLLAMIREDD